MRTLITFMVATKVMPSRVVNTRPVENHFLCFVSIELLCYLFGPNHMCVLKFLCDGG